MSPFVRILLIHSRAECIHLDLDQWRLIIWPVTVTCPQTSEVASMRPSLTAVTNPLWSRSFWSAYSMANSPIASSKVALAPI
jgi:hypothetical protein